MTSSFCCFWGVGVWLVGFQCVLHTCQTSLCGRDPWPQWPRTLLVTPSSKSRVSVCAGAWPKAGPLTEENAAVPAGCLFHSLTSRSASGHERGRDLLVKECGSSPFSCWCYSLDVDDCMCRLTLWIIDLSLIWFSLWLNIIEVLDIDYVLTC